MERNLRRWPSSSVGTRQAFAPHFKNHQSTWLSRRQIDALRQGEFEDLALRGLNVDEATRMITTYDVRWACDVMRPAYDASHGIDGRVSLDWLREHHPLSPEAVQAGIEASAGGPPGP